MKRDYLLGIILAITATGCSEYESGQDGTVLKDEKISFSVSQTPTVSETRSVGYSAEPLEAKGYEKVLWLLPEMTSMVPNMTTRGTQLTSNDFMSHFGVSAYKTSKDKGDLDGRTPDYFYNLKATRIGTSSDYQLSQEYYWPSNDERLWFFAYYPYNSGTNKPLDNLNVVLSGASATGPEYRLHRRCKRSRPGGPDDGSHRTDRRIPDDGKPTREPELRASAHWHPLQGG